MAGKFRRARVVASAGVLIGGLWGSSMALFTDTASVADNDFDSGTLSIDTTPTAAVVSLSSMAPGDRVTNPLTVENDGDLDLRYAMTGTATGDAGLAGALVVRVKSGVTTCTTAGFGGSGTTIATGTLTANGFGNPDSVASPGDRNLVAGASEVLCIQVELPTTAADTLQNKSASGTFRFDAVQTDNN